MVRAVFFDWDGTLADTAEASFRCYVRLFASYGIAFDRETYARTYSPNWYHTFREVGLDEEHWRDADAQWLEHFACEEVALIDGARELLAALAERGVANGIVTSGSRERVSRELAAHALTPYVRASVFGCDVVAKKPHPEGLLLAMEKLGVRAEEAVYVGDSPEDIAMARAAGVYSVAVPGTYPNRDALLASAPDAFAHSLAGVLEVLDGR
ncbi:MAG: HAD family hydrolase [Acidobacteria bacterium]|nr:HAD family hydrolase [Acidobacteriota bacterium]MBV9475527.1 HAD family hydrolase [Acidobacteriota bacterium]